MTLPTLPPWESLHPAIVHFPVALLLVAPLLLLVGIFVPAGKGRPYFVASLLLMALGTAGAWLAVATGEATADIVERSAALQTVLERHEQLAQLTRTVFTILTALFAAIVLVPGVTRQTEKPLFAWILPVAFLAVYGAGALLLANTAHNGGRLVHELGSSPSTVASSVVGPGEHIDAD